MSTPVSLSRTTIGLTTGTILDNIFRSTQDITDAQARLIAQRAFIRASEAPTKANETLTLITQLRKTQQFQENRRQAITKLRTYDQKLSEIEEILIRAKQTAIAAVDPSVDRKSLYFGINEDLERLVSLANYYDGREYIFGGTRVEKEPFKIVNGLVEFLGNTEDTKTRTNDGETISFKVDADTAFGAVSNDISSNVDLNPQATSRTRLTDLNAGKGVELGTLVLRVGTRGSQTPRTASINLEGADTLSDVVNLINRDPTNVVQGVSTSPNTLFTASIYEGRLRIELNEEIYGNYENDLVLTAEGLGGSNVAVDLGLDNNTAGTVVSSGNAASSATITHTAKDGTVTTQVVSTDGSATSALENAEQLRDAINTAFSNKLEAEVVTPTGTANATVAIRPVDGGFSGASVDVSAGTADFSTTSGGFTSDHILLSSELDPKLTMQTKLSDLRFANGAAFNYEGLHIENGGESVDLSFATLDPTNAGNKEEPTLQNLFGLIERAGVFVKGKINDDGDGIELYSTLSGSPLLIRDIDTQVSGTATQLGVNLDFARTYLTDLNSFKGINDDALEVGMSIYTHDRNATNSSGTSGLDAIRIDIPSIAGMTVQDFLDTINDDEQNQFDYDSTLGGSVTGTFVKAKLNSTSDGIVIEDRTQILQFNGLDGINDSGGTAHTLNFDVSNTTDSASLIAGTDFTDLDSLVTAINNSALNATTQNVYALRDGNNIRLVSPTGVITFSETDPGGGGAAIINDETDSTASFAEQSFRIERDENSFTPEAFGIDQGVGNSGVINGKTMQAEGHRTVGAFSALSNLRNALLEDDLAALPGIQLQLKQAIDKILATRETIGQREQSLGGELALGDDFDGSATRLTARISEVAGIDPVQAKLKLDEFMAIFQLGLSSASRVVQVSLLDYI
ncbi:MAG: hypothetical protein NUW37_01470 [Planctomycetes bacterium]|nr:hypothetical protein [Planctomycetota bacterium]